VLAVTVVLLASASVAARGAGLVWDIKDLTRWFDVDAEANLPTWFAASLLMLSAVLAATIACSPTRGVTKRWHWVLLSGVLVALSIDEATRLHEGIGEGLQQAWETDGLLNFAWVVPYGLVGLVLLVLMIPYLAALPPRTRNLFLTAGVIYVIGAAGVNAIIGSLIDSNPPDGLVSGLGLLEEVMEMAGLSILLYGLLDFVRSAAVPSMPDSTAGTGP
jgi:hypothetical protein